MLCHFGQLRNFSVVNHFIRFSSTATSSATSEYVTVPERIGQNEDRDSGNEERGTNQPIPLQNCIYINRSKIVCIFEHVIMNSLCLYFLL